jgi:disulfide oxidoreductase YuzD
MFSAMAFFLPADFLYHAAVDCANKPGSCHIGDWLSAALRPHRKL